MDLSKLTPTLTEEQIKQNIDVLQKGGTSNDKIQSYVNMYKKGTNGNYVLNSSSGDKGFGADLGADFSKRREDVSKIDSSQQSLPSKILQNVGQVFGGVSDIVSEGSKALGLDKLISSIPTVDPDTGKLTTLGASLPTHVEALKKAASGIQLVQDISKKFEDFSTKHPEAVGDLHAIVQTVGGLFSAVGAADLVGGVEKAAGGSAKDAAIDESGQVAKDATEGAPAPKEPTIKPKPGVSQLTPVPEPVKTSVKNITEKLGPAQTKSWISDLFSQAKTAGKDINASSPSVKLAGDQLEEAKGVLDTNIKKYGSIKDETISKFGDTPVTGFSKDGKFVPLSETIDSFNGRVKELLTGRVSLTTSQEKTLANFQRELSEISGKAGNVRFKGTDTLKEVDSFVDRYGGMNVLGTSGTNTNSLNSLINSTVHDINESAKVAADSVDGGAYRQANDVLTKNLQAKDDLVKSLGDLKKGSGKYTGAAKFYASALQEGSPAQVTLKNIQDITGIPISDTVNIARFVEASQKVPGITEIAKTAGIAATGMVGGKYRLFNALTKAIGDPENALFLQVDKANGGVLSSSIKQIGDALQKSPEALKSLQDSGLDVAQGATMILLGQVGNPTKSGKNNSEE